MLTVFGGWPCRLAKFLGGFVKLINSFWPRMLHVMHVMPHTCHVQPVQLIWLISQNISEMYRIQLTNSPFVVRFLLFLHQKKTTHQSTPTTLAAIPRWSFRRKSSGTHLSKVIQLTFIWKTEEFNEAAQCWHHLEKSLPLNNSNGCCGQGNGYQFPFRSGSKRLITNIKVWLGPQCSWIKGLKQRGGLKVK